MYQQQGIQDQGWDLVPEVRITATYQRACELRARGRTAAYLETSPLLKRLYISCIRHQCSLIIRLGIVSRHHKQCPLLSGEPCHDFHPYMNYSWKTCQHGIQPIDESYAPATVHIDCLLTFGYKYPIGPTTLPRDKLRRPRRDGVRPWTNQLQWGLWASAC